MNRNINTKVLLEGNIMTKIKLEHIDNLRQGKKSGSKIGSRWVPHHLYKYEEEKYKRALKYRFLEITNKDRVNLRNIWQKVCLVKWWKNYVLMKNLEQAHAIIYLSDLPQMSGDIKSMKQVIKDYV